MSIPFYANIDLPISGTNIGLFTYVYYVQLNFLDDIYDTRQNNNQDKKKPPKMHNKVKLKETYCVQTPNKDSLN